MQRRTRLYHALCRELAIAEHRAEMAPLARARQLGLSPPANAFVAIAAHAQSMWPSYVAAVGERELGLGLGRELANAVSATRYALVERWRDPQRAYRKTLAELHDGVACARVLHALARTRSMSRLVRWCDDMIPARVELIAYAEQALGWFAANDARRFRTPASRLRVAAILSPEHLSLLR